MFRIVLLLFAGIGAGYLLRNWSFVARLERGVSLTVWALLFVFGVTIGSNRELIVNFGRFGWQGKIAGLFLGMMLIGNNAGVVRTVPSETVSRTQTPTLSPEEQTQSGGMRR